MPKGTGYVRGRAALPHLGRSAEDPDPRCAAGSANDHPAMPATPAMTLIEMTIVVFVVGVGLFLLIGWVNNVRQAAKRDLAIRLLADLDKALVRYHRATGCYPTSHGPNSAIQATIDLLDHDRTRPILLALPQAVWETPAKRNLVDPWGTPLQYHSATSGSALVKANNGRPIFVSAGPDRRFGDGDPAGLGDNLRSDDPGPNGFRLQQALREAMTDKEQSGGEEND
ncbi:MAG: type II secretion system protein [Phycisphaerae bacterium]|nr:type II secretion system protein [Phycisphaerae bacterium]